MTDMNAPAYFIPICPGVAAALNPYGNRVNVVVQTVGEVEKNIRVNGDEWWPVWSRGHSRP